MTDVNTDDLISLSEQYRLRFPKLLEQQFQSDYFRNLLQINRIGLIVGLILWSIFGVIDYWAMPESYPTVWLIRFGICAPIIVLIIILSYTSSYFRLFRLLSTTLTLAAGLGVVAMVMVSNPNEVGYYYYIFGLMVVLIFLYTIPGGQFTNVVIASLVLFTAGQLAYITRPDFLHTQFATVTYFLIMVFFATFIMVGVVGNYFYERSLRRSFLQRLIIEREQDRSHALLLNTIPALIAERLMRGEIVADHYQAISILFADIVDFTPLSSRAMPTEIIDLLNQVFSTFDDLTEHCTLEKIKTIGDAYMVVSGIPVPRPDHAEALADLALDMLRAITTIDYPGIGKLKIRIGLHSGPVVAGVIGWKKFAYDLWGDTVNTASRMESHGTPGKIQVSEEYYLALKDKYIFEDRGEIEIKGKGKMHTYFLTGKLSPNN